MRRDSIGVMVFCMLSAATATCPASAQIIRGEAALLGQVRKGDKSGNTEAPVNLYGQASLSELWRHSSANTYFRVEQDLAGSNTETDLYTAYADIPGAIPGLQAVGGRQFLNESPAGVTIADAGKLRFNPGWPVSFSAFGGKPRYFDPDYSHDDLSDDEIIWGGSMRAARFMGADVSLGYLQFERESKVLKQLVSGTLSRSFPTLPGVPRLYGSVAYDADHQNLDLGTGGVDVMLAGLGLQLNAEGSYYKPQDHEDGRPTLDLNHREDPIYEMFADSQMGQGRAGAHYAFSPALAMFCDYSFQHYDQLKNDQAQNSHVASAGILWLPEGDGLETVRLEYYIIETEDDQAIGGKVLYESRVYERLLFRSTLDVTGYDTVGNQGAIAVGSRVGIGYALADNLSIELNFEANHNDRFDQDFRFGFFIDYNFRQAVGLSRPAFEAQS